MEKFKIGSIALTLGIVAFLLGSATACHEKSDSDKSDKRLLWKAESGELILSDAGVSFKLPGNNDNWLIAEPERLPEKVLFTCVDTTSQTCVMFMDFSEYGSVNSMTDESLISLIRKIMHQQEEVTKDSLYYTRGKFRDKSYMRFKSKVEANAENGSYLIDFRGTLFDGHTPNKAYGLIITQPGERITSDADSIEQKIYTSLSSVP